MRKKQFPLKGIIVSLAGFGLMMLGIYRGEAMTVFSKAIRICLECIGIG